MTISRRNLLWGLVAAPAIVHINNIMRIVPIPAFPAGPFYRKVGNIWIPDNYITVSLTDPELLSKLKGGTL